MIKFNSKFLFIVVIFTIIFFFLFNIKIVEGAITKDDVNEEIPAKYIPLYQKAALKYGVPWMFLASVHNQETTFSSNVSKSSAGAIGHAQFMRCTWVGWGYSGCKGTLGNSSNVTDKVLKDVNVIKQYKGYGVDGNQDGIADPWDIVDGIYSMAGYLAHGTSKGNGSEKDNLIKAALTYNHSTKYANEVYNRYERYKKGFSGNSPQGTMNFDGKVQEGLWGDDLGNLEGGSDRGESDDSSGGLDTGGDYEHVSPFKEYVVFINNIGLNYKANHDAVFQDYKFNKYVEYVIKVLYNLSFVFGILLLGYVSILWMFILLARTNFIVAYNIVKVMTQGKIDAYDDLGKIIKLTLVFIVFVVIAISGLMPLIFALVYKLLGSFITLVFRL